ncbi:hypothetical protein OROMI_017947 [Orobanche minor]
MGYQLLDFFVCLVLVLSTNVNGAGFVNVTLIQSAASQGAVCLDGSPPGYAFDKGSGCGSNNWLVYIELGLQGGAWCYSTPDCADRTKGFYGNSSARNRLYFSGILDQNKTFNPNFYNWNRVYLVYCDGSSFLGDAEDVDPKTLHCYDITNIIMEEAERSLPYVTSLDCPYPLAVSYAPVMSITSGDQRRVRHTRPPVVVEDVSGPRSTWSARPVVDEEPAEQTRPARRRVDMRKGGRVQMPDSSSSSSGGHPPPPRADMDMIRDIVQTEVRASEARIRDDMRAEIKASEGRLKTWMKDMFDSIRFVPARRSPPITASGVISAFSISGEFPFLWEFVYNNSLMTISIS